MSGRGEKKERSGLNMLFFSARGARFAVDAGQVAGTAAFTGEPEDGLPLLYGVPLGAGRPVDTSDSTVLLINAGGCAPFRIVVDVLEDMAEISADDIRSFPPLIEPFALRGGMWGVVERNGRMVMLLDFQRLIRNKDRVIPLRDIPVELMRLIGEKG